MSITVPPEIAEKRLQECKKCEHFTNISTCKKCGCFMLLKVKLSSSRCPIDKWK